ncbi:D-alanyl-D-alanine carboxypeptidase [Candidatus Daviesbacteria bacterium]|nr:D-alanyl-D-alanine carboxypeptidase [Candidatus Daviesbacteria bacterium]
MRDYLYSAGLLLFGVIIAVVIPLILSFTNNLVVKAQIPQNNAQVAGVQKYNIPPVGKNLPMPFFTARAVLVKDLGTETVLYQKDSNISYPIASTTKIMTALVANEYFKQNSVLIVGSSANISGSRVGLAYGEDLTFRSLLYGMLLNSGNDAAFALAENYPGGLLGFVSAMNKKVIELGLKNTRFDNPAGFDSPNHYSSAGDLAKITQEAIKNPNLARIFATKETNIVSVNKQYTHQLFNLNRLLSDVKGVLGVKTGRTEGAKENLVTLVQRDGHKILLVILGSDDRFGETTGLINWAYSNFQWAKN